MSVAGGFRNVGSGTRAKRRDASIVNAHLREKVWPRNAYSAGTIGRVWLRASICGERLQNAKFLSDLETAGPLFSVKKKEKVLDAACHNGRQLRMST